MQEIMVGFCSVAAAVVVVVAVLVGQIDWQTLWHSSRKTKHMGLW